MKQLNTILVQRLKRKGMTSGAIPGYLRNLTNTLCIHPQLTLREINRKLHGLGWNDFDLDYHTLPEPGGGADR